MAGRRSPEEQARLDAALRFKPAFDALLRQTPDELTPLAWTDLIL